MMARCLGRVLGTITTQPACHERDQTHTSPARAPDSWKSRQARDAAWLMSAGAKSLVNEVLIGIMNASSACLKRCTYLPIACLTYRVPAHSS